MFFEDEIEIVHSDFPRGRFRSVLFDFDGTLSLIREGWPQVMIPMMVEVLRETGTAGKRRRAGKAWSRNSSCGSTAGRPFTR